MAAAIKSFGGKSFANFSKLYDVNSSFILFFFFVKWLLAELKNAKLVDNEFDNIHLCIIKHYLTIK